MAENTKIEWCHATFNPWWGCRAVSPACDNCYAEAFSRRTGRSFSPPWRTSAHTWKQPLIWNRKAEKEGRRMRVFCASMADVFDAEVPDAWRDELFALITVTPHLDWLLLTKRPKVSHDYLTSKDRDEAIGHLAFDLLERQGRISTDQSALAAGLLHVGGGHMLAGNAHLAPHAQAWPLANVWLGTTVENQAMAEARIPWLLKTPAAVRFLSMEPLLGPVSLSAWPLSDAPLAAVRRPSIAWQPSIDWVIAGGESGTKARPSHPEWFRTIRDQCAAAGVPFLFKQWGEWIGAGQTDAKGWCVCGPSYAADDPIRVGKKAAGRLLDGVQHNAFPAAVSP